MQDELKSLQISKLRGPEASVQSSRSSIESSRSPSRLGSPILKNRIGSIASTTTESGAAAVDYVYLKNVLLQFLEQKDKKHQMQLIPVLGMLLHFDKKDEQKWMSAVTTAR